LAFIQPSVSTVTYRIITDIFAIQILDVFFQFLWFLYVTSRIMEVCFEALHQSLYVVYLREKQKGIISLIIE